MHNFLIRVDDLQVDFHSENETVRAVDAVSFTLPEASTLAIVGESGSGKSVTALSIMKLLPVNARLGKHSKMLFCNKNGGIVDISGFDDKQMQKLRGNEISMVFQEPMTSLNPLMRCGEQVAETLRLHAGLSKNEAQQRTLALFAEVKIPSPEQAWRKYPHELSGGQKQRVMIAMAISCQPKLLIADEPTTALDVTVQKSILELLKQLQEKYRMSILFITHDLHLVKTFADEVLVMYKSKIVESGPTHRVFAAPTHAYTQDLINCRPKKGTRVKLLSTVGHASVSNIDPKNMITQPEYADRIRLLAESPVLLELRDLQVWYATRRNFLGKETDWYKAVQGVNLCIRQGETMGLVGESGCGKTTIGKAIVKLAEINAGDIFFKGKSIRGLRGDELQQYRREVQIIFQDPYSSLNPRLSIGQAIKEPMDVHYIEQHKNRKDRVIALLEKVGLHADHYHRYPHEFSGGQRQRISIARALALEARFIICDESVSALDVSVQAQVLNLLVSLREEFGFTYLFISHDLQVIRHISDHVAVMKNGLITECNDAESLYRMPQEIYTRQLLAATEA